MIAFGLGLIIGFLMCIPVGPLNVWVVNVLIKHNFKSAFSIALGGSLMDFIYFMVVLTGLNLFNFSEATTFKLKILGVIVLFGFGLKEVLNKSQSFKVTQDLEKKIPHASSFFLVGVLIYVTNPTLIATMSALAAIIKSWRLFNYDYFNYFALSIGIALGSASWFYTLLKIVQKYQNKIPERFFINFNKACGVLILMFSFIMAFKVYKESLL